MPSTVCVSLGPCRAVCGCRKTGVPGRALWGVQLRGAAVAAPSSSGRGKPSTSQPGGCLGPLLAFGLPAGRVHHDRRCPPSAGCSPRPGSPTWLSSGGCALASSASASSAWAGVSRARAGPCPWASGARAAGELQLWPLVCSLVPDVAPALLSGHRGQLGWGSGRIKDPEDGRPSHSGSPALPGLPALVVAVSVGFTRTKGYGTSS